MHLCIYMHIYVYLSQEEMEVKKKRPSQDDYNLMKFQNVLTLLFSKSRMGSPFLYS